MTGTGRAILVLGLVMLMTTGATAADRVLVIGLDGADWDVMEPLLEDGRLPHIQELMEQGRHGPLTSTLPTESPVAWTSMTTGTDPGGHGIYGFVELVDGQLQPLTAEDVQAERVWELSPGRSIVLNVPQTFPPAAINGSLVASYLAVSGEPYTHPKGLQDELEELGYRTEVLEDSFQQGDEEEFLEALNATVTARTAAADRLLGRQDWRLGFVVYTGLDRLQHYFWDDRQDPSSPYHGAIADHYERLDAEIGQLLEHAGDNTTIMLVSDHGFTGLQDYVYLNHWLREQGYLELETGDSGSGGILRSLGLTQENLVDLLDSLGLLGPVRSVLSFIGISPGSRLPSAGLEDIDLERTEAYAGNYGGRIHITVDDPQRRAELMDELSRKLEQLTHPGTGEHVFEAVHNASAFYDQTTGKTPDLVLEPAPGYRAVGFLGHRQTFGSPPAKTGTHARDGIYVLAGPGIEHGTGNASITDIAPTILAALGQRPPDGMDGRSLIE